MSFRRSTKNALNWLVSPFGLEIRRRTHDWSDTRNFIPLEETLAASERMGLSVGDYIDKVLNNIPGATQFTIDEMSRFGTFSQAIQTVLEIGPGSGRYLEKTLALCSPSRYEIYETSVPWASFLVKRYGVVFQPTNGGLLNSTTDASCDLVHAHKVFSTIPFLPTIQYWSEMVRVARRGAYVVFDIMTEECLDMPTLKEWRLSKIDNGSYPATMPRAVAIEFFTTNDCSLVGSFFVPMGKGRTEAFIFRKR